MLGDVDHVLGGFGEKSTMWSLEMAPRYLCCLILLHSKHQNASDSMTRPIWRFPQMGVPLNHPFEYIFMGFSIRNHPLGGTPIYGNPHDMVGVGCEPGDRHRSHTSDAGFWRTPTTNSSRTSQRGAVETSPNVNNCNMSHDLAGASTPSAAFPSTAFSDASDSGALRQARAPWLPDHRWPKLTTAGSRRCPTLHWFVVPSCILLFLNGSYCLVFSFFPVR